MEKNQCIREVPSFTIQNSEGANNVYESLPMIDDSSGLKIRFLGFFRTDFWDRKSAIVVRALLH